MGEPGVAEAARGRCDSLKMLRHGYPSVYAARRLSGHDRMEITEHGRSEPVVLLMTKIHFNEADLSGMKRLLPSCLQNEYTARYGTV
jgi:hypothetical protein